MEKSFIVRIGIGCNSFLDAGFVPSALSIEVRWLCLRVHAECFLGISVERNVIEMVHRHLPELEALLEQLKKKEPKQYEAAVRNLAKSQRRLQIAEKRGSQMFELEVRLVQTQTSINLLIAKLKVRDKDADRNALRAATKTLAELQLNKSQLELAQMKSRLAKLQETVNNAETRVEQQESALKQGLESSYQTYLRKAGRK